MPHIDFAVGIGGAAGQGVATPGNLLAKLFARRGLHINAYNAYQSIIRGGHTFLTIRTSEEPVRCMGDDLAMLIPLNQDTMDRHVGRMRAGASVLYDRDRVKPGAAAEGVQLCPLPLSERAKNILYYNTAAVAAVLRLVSVELKTFEEMLAEQFKRKGAAVVAENVMAARAGYEYAGAHFKPYAFSLPDTGKRLAVATGNESLAMGGVAAGVKFYCAYPMSPSTGVLMWMARHGRQLGIMVRQVEDELGVINMAIGAAHTGCRAMCATSGGGFALMTEALGAAAMMEIPLVCINVQRAGPATGVPTKTEPGDLWQVLGAGQGDYPRIIAAPTSIRDCFHLIPQIFNLADKFQCPGIVLADLLESEGFSSFEPSELDFNPPRDRGDVVGLNGDSPPANGGFKRYLITESGISPNTLQVKWLVPLHVDAIVSILSKSPKVIIVENNYSGQFARYLRSETGIVADGHIQKYDGEPFMPHHIVEGVRTILAGSTKH